MGGTISSRTPEGTPDRCPLCGAAVRVEPSVIAGDAPCPSCGTLLWFAKGSDAALFYDAADVGELLDRIAPLLAEEGIDLRRLSEGEVDSLDLAEVVMLLEN